MLSLLYRRGGDDSVGLIEREKRRKKGEMDLDVTSLLEEALQQGIWAAYI